MKLHKGSLKLAGLYLTIIMFISLFFSVSIYELSTRELDRGLKRPAAVLEDGPLRGIVRETREALKQENEAIYQEAKNRISERLVFTNAIILIAAGFLSYYLAVRTLKPIEEANESLERFTADASHELRTPISAMQSEIEVALMNPKLKLSESKAILQSNLEELAKLTALSDGLLKLARVGNGSLPRQPVNMRGLIKSSVKDIESSAKSRKVAIKVSGNSDISVLGDKSSLAEALKIILDNAIKYSPEKSEVEVRVSHNQKQVTIKVQDQGIGIKATELPYIFERFYRADSSRSKSKVEGYGIGLAIAKNIIELHRGTISVVSEPEQGSIFTVKLPLS